MERLTIDEIIGHCKRQTDGHERRMSAEQYETADMNNFFVQEYWEHRQVAEYLEELKEYRKAEEQGLLLRLPVAEGAEVFVIDFIYECKYQFNCRVTFREYRCEEGEFCEHQYKKHIVKSARFNYAMMKKLGKTVFLTREESESALSEKGGAE